jgi:hypothetical protein
MRWAGRMPQSQSGAGGGVPSAGIQGSRPPVFFNSSLAAVTLPGPSNSSSSDCTVRRS